MEIRSLLETDDRARFRSNEPDLDRFFHKYAGQNQFRHHIGTTYVAVDDDRILGYVTLATGHVEIEKIPAKLRRSLPRYPLPVLRLARLAVDHSARGRGIGRALLRYAFLLTRKLATEYGCFGVVVDAKPSAVDFYTRFGFQALEVVEGEGGSRPRSSVMFLSFSEIEAASRATGS